MSFYVVLNSAENLEEFPLNSAALFTSSLNKQICLTNEYNVAVSSVLLWDSKLLKCADSQVRSKRDTLENSELYRVKRIDAPQAALAASAGSAASETTDPPTHLNAGKVCEIPLQMPTFTPTVEQQACIDRGMAAILSNSSPYIAKAPGNGGLCSVTITVQSSKNTALKSITKSIEYNEPRYFIRKSFVTNVAFADNILLNAIVGKVAASSVTTTTTTTTTASQIPATFSFNLEFSKGTLSVSIEGLEDMLKLREEYKIYVTWQGPIDRVFKNKTLSMPNGKNSDSISFYVEADLTELPDHRNHSFDADYIASVNLDNLHRYSTANGDVNDLFDDFKVVYLERATYSFDRIKADLAKSEFKDIFTDFIPTKSLMPKIQPDNRVCLISRRIATGMKLPMKFKFNDGRDLEIRIEDPELDCFKIFNHRITDWLTVDEYVNKSVNLRKLYTLKFTNSNSKPPLPESVLRITYSPHVKLKLPYVLNYFSITCDENVEQWPITIYYQSAKGVDQVVKNILVERKKTGDAQGEVIEEAAQKEFNDTHIKSSITYPAGEVKMTRLLTVQLPLEAAKLYKVPPIMRSSTPAVAKPQESKHSHTPLWITCDLIDETLVGRGALKLLTPNPVNLDNPELVSKQYVPVASNRFSQITLSCYSDIASLTPFSTNRDLMVVLHFSPRYKRIRTFTENDSLDSYKKFCCNYG